jgi:uncharacterized membrane protein
MGFCCNGFGWGGGWMGWGGGWVGALVNLGLFAGVVVLLGLGTVWLVRRIRVRTLTPEAASDPLDIARRRLAAGEITATEFEEIRDRLRS